MSSNRPKLRLLYLGMAGEFSLIPLHALLARPEEVEICGVILPAASGGEQQSGIRQLEPPPPVSELQIVNRYFEKSIKQLAWAHQIPCFELSQPQSREALELIASLEPDLAFTACFTKIVPPELLAIPRFGFTNLHPSLLPEFRGPEPIFWIFQQGGRAGVTLHFMDQGIDSGDIIGQSPISLPDGISGPEASRLAAQEGSQLLLSALAQCRQGTLQGRPQPPGGSYQPAPTPGAFRLDTDSTAKRAFNFMRGTAEWGVPYLVEMEGRQLRLNAAVSFSTEGSLAQKCIRSEKLVQLQFAEGTLTATLW